MWGEWGRCSFTQKAKEILFVKAYVKQDKSGKLSTQGHPFSIHYFQDIWYDTLTSDY